MSVRFVMVPLFNGGMRLWLVPAGPGYATNRAYFLARYCGNAPCPLSPAISLAETHCATPASEIGEGGDDVAMKIVDGHLSFAARPAAHRNAGLVHGIGGA